MEKSRQTRDVMETGCLLSTMQCFGVLYLLQDPNIVLASMIGIFFSLDGEYLYGFAGVNPGCWNLRLGHSVYLSMYLTRMCGWYVCVIFIN